MRSIDVRNVIAKSKEVEGIQKAQHKVTTTGQQAFEAELSKRAEEKSSKVQSSPETQHEKIRSDDRGQRGGAEKGEPNARMLLEDADAGGDVADSEEDFGAFPGQIIDVEV